MSPLQRAIYPVKVTWLRSKLAECGYKIVADVSIKKKRSYMKNYMRKRRATLTAGQRE